MEDPPSEDPSLGPSRIPYLSLMLDHGWVNGEIASHKYPGSGTREDPFVIGWLERDPRNPVQFSRPVRWILTAVASVMAFAVSMAMSAYSAPSSQVMETFSVSEEIFQLGLSMFILGFAVGPVIWSPACELYGRQVIFLGTFVGYTLFNVGCWVTPTIEGLIVMRFLAGAFGSSTLTIPGGILADIWPDRERGRGMIVLSSAPLFGPIMGPVIGGFLGESAGWRWVQGFLAINGGVFCIMIALVMPETYAPVLLARRAHRLSRMTGHHFVSKLEKGPKKTLLGTIRVALTRPWSVLFFEPIVLLLSIYMAILYGTLYLFFAAFPIVYQEYRGWDQGIGGLSFLGLAVGVILGIIYTFFVDLHYLKTNPKEQEHQPESRLPPALVGCIAIPISLFWFAWTNGPSVHWVVSLAAQAPFGFGFVLVYLSVQNYLVDAYTIFAASVLAANVMLRCIVGASFPLFTSYMYHGLGIHWATCIPAFLALLCVPFPFAFYRYGERIRAKCRFAAKAAQHTRELRQPET